MRHFVFRWIATTIAVFVAAPIVGINYGDRLGCLLGASLLLGIINAFVRPVLLSAESAVDSRHAWAFSF